MNEQRQKVWDKAVDTLASMCIDDKMGNGSTKEAFVVTLRLFANNMEELIVKDRTDECQRGMKVFENEGLIPEYVVVPDGLTKLL